MSKSSEYAAESYKWYKSRGICVQCRKEFAEIGKTMCPLCLEKKNSQRKLGRENNPDVIERDKIAGRERYHRLKNSGICTQCGKKPVYTKNGHKLLYCYECWLARKRWNLEHSAARSKHLRECGLCIKCGGERVDGKMVCENCLANLQEHAKRCFDPFRKENAKRWKQTWNSDLQEAEKGETI